jgi:hypothetical protein
LERGGHRCRIALGGLDRDVGDLLGSGVQTVRPHQRVDQPIEGGRDIGRLGRKGLHWGGHVSPSVAVFGRHYGGRRGFSRKQI